MSANEKNNKIAQTEPYSTPEIVRMGDAIELTAGGGDPLSDGYTNPKSYKNAPYLPPTEPTSRTEPTI